MRVRLASAVGAMAGILSAAIGCFALGGNSVLANTSTPAVLGIDVYGGNCTTQINAGSSLIANHIVENALVIGGRSGTPAVVTIDASDTSGNPLAVNSIDPRTSETIPVGPLAPHDLFRAGVNSSALVRDNANFGLRAAPSGPGSSSTNAGAAVVPEPSSLILLAVALILVSPKTMLQSRHGQLGYES